MTITWAQNFIKVMREEEEWWWLWWWWWVNSLIPSSSWSMLRNTKGMTNESCRHPLEFFDFFKDSPHLFLVVTGFQVNYPNRKLVKKGKRKNRCLYLYTLHTFIYVHRYVHATILFIVQHITSLHRYMTLGLFMCLSLSWSSVYTPIL